MATEPNLESAPQRLSAVTEQLTELSSFLDPASLADQVKELETRMGAEGFWDNQDEAARVSAEHARVSRRLERWQELSGDGDDLATMLELVDEDSSLAGEFEGQLVDVERRLSAFEEERLFAGDYDAGDALVTVNAGAGGTDAQDWAEMVLRMMMRWAESRGFEVELLEASAGEEAGIKSATFKASGENAYGLFCAERGVHRLVRISPFDANARRHTSFASVDVVAEIDDDIDVEVNEADLRVDVYRSSGKGGQHVNKTESAVRLTHIPTGIVVACQRERSQVKNRALAMKILRARIYEKTIDDKRAEMEKYYGEKGDIGWGNQIRSYVFQPYQMVKDLRTGVETGNIQAVMDGDIDAFINGWLRAGGPRTRNKDIKIED